MRGSSPASKDEIGLRDRARLFVIFGGVSRFCQAETWLTFLLFSWARVCQLLLRSTQYDGKRMDADEDHFRQA